MFILICRYNRVFAYPGDDITLSSHLSPETSAVSMEVRWFRGTECIYLYKSGQVSVGRGYEGRASLIIPELERGNVSLILKSISPLDTGTYSCQVLTGHNMVEKSICLYMSGMEPLSPDAIGPKLTEQDAVDMQESVLILELKKLLQEQDKELQDKTRELETTTEMLKTKSSLLLYTDMDLENMNKLANQKEEHLKSVTSELETCKGLLETLGRKLEEKTAQVEELRVVLQDKEREVWESKEQHITDGLENASRDTADTQRDVDVLDLQNLLEDKEKELEEKTRQLETVTGELTRMATLLKGREAEVEKLAKEKDEFVKGVAGEMELCVRELETLGQKLQEKNTQVEELRVALQDTERELEGEKSRRGESEGVMAAKKMVEASREPFASDLLEKSEDLLSKITRNPKEQLEELESWMNQKREERRLSEEAERTAGLEKEFLEYVSAVEELIGKKHETMVAWEKMAAVLRDKLEVVETDEEREALETQVTEALEMQRQGEEQIRSLSEGIEEKRSAIEQKHKQEMEEIREKYGGGAASKTGAETNSLEIILPDVQAYFRNMAADMQGILEARRRIVTNETAGERRNSVDVSGPEINNNNNNNNNCEETLVHEEAQAELQAREDTDSEDERSSDVENGVIGEEQETEEEIEEEEEEEEEQEEVREVNEHVETDEEDVVNTQ